MMLKKLGRNLKSIRLEAGLSRTAVAKEVKVSNATLARIEDGKHNMRLVSFQRLCKFYKVLPSKVLE